MEEKESGNFLNRNDTIEDISEVCLQRLKTALQIIIILKSPDPRNEHEVARHQQLKDIILQHFFSENYFIRFLYKVGKKFEYLISAIKDFNEGEYQTPTLILAEHFFDDKKNITDLTHNLSYDSQVAVIRLVTKKTARFNKPTRVVSDLPKSQLDVIIALLQTPNLRTIIEDKDWKDLKRTIENL